jgi:hypothetical protein
MDRRSSGLGRVTVWIYVDLIVALRVGSNGQNLLIPLQSRHNCKGALVLFVNQPAVLRLCSLCLGYPAQRPLGFSGFEAQSRN